MKQIKARFNLLRQCTDTVLMVRPLAFGYNHETASTNAFQQHNKDQESSDIQLKAVEEFDDLAAMLKEHNIQVIIVEDTPLPVKPDAIFPNNWITTHSDGTIITYPLHSNLRRPERREDILELLSNEFKVQNQYSFEHYEEEGKYLEGTGSMILDRINHIVYACLSPRTDPELLEHFTLLKQYHKVSFKATDPSGTNIYHTNVMLALGETQAIVCLECIHDGSEKEAFVQSLINTGKEIIEIKWEQVLHFAGNMLQLKNIHGDLYWVMSSAALDILDEGQRSVLQSNAGIIGSPISTIEYYGGGSVRCMLTEIFLQRK
ncbi:MAG: arginine deiminase-related protein [Saprospiraceae bacterium]